MKKFSNIERICLIEIKWILMTDNIRVYVEGLGEMSVDRGSTLEELSKLIYKEDYKNI